MARSFNGTSDVINAGTATVLLPAAISVSCWFNASSLANTYSGLVTRFDLNDGSKNYYNLYVKSTGGMAYYINPTVGVNLDPGSGTVTTNTWNQVGFAYDSVNGLKTFLNGTSDGTLAANGAFGVDPVYHFRMGAEIVFANRFLNGSMADVAVWNTNLTAAEFAALAKGARPGTVRSPNLIGWWPLDGLQSPEPDLSGKINNGTLTGTALAAGAPIMMFSPRAPLIMPNTAIAGQTFQPAWAMRNRIIVEGIGI